MSHVSSSEEFDLYEKGSAPVLLTMRIVVFFLVLDVAFRWLGFERVRSWVMRRSEARPRHEECQSIDELVMRSYRAVVAATAVYYRRRKDCLPRALAIYHFLRARGAPVEFRLGVKKFPFSAHAWVEYRGQVVDISPRISSRYIVMKTVGGTGRGEHE